ncbi:hypothetical protein [Gemmata sp.]|uniref:hypothetical protein n=1 Tax=Gemmata sp. TaxID=1914242 RepID=UPI003F6EE2AC
MEHIPVWHAAVVGLRCPGRVIAVSLPVLLLDLDLTRLAPGRSPTLRAELHFDRTVAPERAGRLALRDAVEVTLIEVERHPGIERVVASLPADPEWLAWNDHTVRRLARHVRATGETDLLPVLADALEDAGCADAALLEHCRGQHPPGTRSWAVELLATQQ